MTDIERKERTQKRIVRRLCKAAGGQAEVARYMGKTRQLVQQMLSDTANNKFHLEYFLDAFKKMNLNRKLSKRLSDDADLITVYNLIKKG